MSSNPNCNEAKYIYEMGYLVRMDLCRILNQNGKWEELAGTWMQFEFDIIQKLRNEKNPTDELLTMWSQFNHTIAELFVLLSRMQHYQAMHVLKNMVDPKFHKLIDKGEANLRRLSKERLCKNGKDRELSIDTKNFNQAMPVQSAIPKIILEESIAEESCKILNQPRKSASPFLPPSNSNNLLLESPVLLPPSTALQNLPGTFKRICEIREANLPLAQFEELTLATDDWNKRNTLGRGGFGTVYRGIWKNTDVAIKKIERRIGKSDESYATQLQQSLREIKILNSHPHDNILALYAYSVCGDAPCLVYQFMPNGSLEDRLLQKHKTEPLSCEQRYNIATGTARGLQYLHTIGDKPLIHGDIKSANILLDKNFDPKIGDFGLAREGPDADSIKVSKIYGTRPYLPEDFISCRNLSTKIDTYSYGIVLFELATGLPAFDNNRPECKFLKELMDKWEDKDLGMLMDKKAGFHYKPFHYLILLGKWCSNKFAKDRPEMEQVYKNLSDSRMQYFAFSDA